MNMRGSFLTDLAVQASDWAMGIALIAAILIGLFQPPRALKWFALCFCTIFFCVAALSMNSGLRRVSEVGAGAGRVGFVFGGVSLLVAMVFFIVFLRAGKRASPEDPPRRLDGCTRHAGLLSLFSFIGFFATATGSVALNHLGLLMSLPSWASIPLFLVFSAAPAAAWAYFRPPACPSCQIGRMMVRDLTPVRYRCKKCGHQVRTEIWIGSRR